jgi:phenylacetate-CoA ligase
LQLIVDGFKKRLGESVQVVIARVDAIPAEKSGKFRYIVSHVAGATRT